MIPHQQGVSARFGAQADAYLHSAVHAQGPELDALEAVARERPGARVLDLGCGAGHVSYRVAPLVTEVVAYDLAPQMLALVGAHAARHGLPNIRVSCGTAEALPFPDASYDLVLSRYSAHHWSAPAHALREVCRVLRPEGQWVLADVASPGPALLDTHLQAVEVLRDPSHVRDYSAGEWRDMVIAAGLRPQRQVRTRLRLAFDAWVARMNTPQSQQIAIRALQDTASAEVRDYFEIEPDGSFSVDVLTLWATR